MTFASIVLEKYNETLRGYLMDDGTFQFCFGGKCLTFPDLHAVWQHWANMH